MKTADLIEYAFVSIVFVVAVPFSLSELSLFSMSYHSIAVPLAFLALPLWNSYARCIQKEAPLSPQFCFLLAGYFAICALAKPTFMAYGIPFFATELVRSAKLKMPTVLIRAAVAGCIAITFYLLFLLYFYRSIDGIFGHFKNSSLFMTSQANWYDNAKGSNWLDWYVHYVVGVVGPFAAVGSAFILLCALTPKLNRLITFATMTGLLSALFFLYHRSQAHAHPEFISYVAVLMIVDFRHGGIQDVFEKLALRSAWEKSSRLAAIFLSFGSLYLFFPFALNAKGWAMAMVANNNQIIPVAFSDNKLAKSILVSIYPDVLFGVTDAICRGGGNIFDGNRSRVLEQQFGNFTCLTDKRQKLDDVSRFNYIVFRKEINDANMNAAAERIQQEFPQLSHRIENCRLVGRFSDNAEIAQCTVK
jgi:hypothetical protein